MTDRVLRDMAAAATAQAAVDIGQQEPSNPAADAADALSLLLEQQERQRRSRGGRRRRALHIEAIELLPRSDGVRPTASGACLRRAIDGGALEFDGRRLALAGGAPVLRALSAAAYAAVAEVALVGVPFASILACSGAGSGTGFGALAALAALRHLRRLELRDNGVATLPCLDALAPLSRVRALVIEGSPVSGAALLRPYVAYRLPHVRELNGAPLGRAEAAAGRALLGGFDVEMAAALVGPAQRAALAAAGLLAPPPLALAGAGEGQWPVAAAAVAPPGRRDGARSRARKEDRVQTTAAAANTATVTAASARCCHRRHHHRSGSWRCARSWRAAPRSPRPSQAAAPRQRAAPRLRAPCWAASRRRARAPTRWPRDGSRCWRSAALRRGGEASTPCRRRRLELMRRALRSFVFTGGFGSARELGVATQWRRDVMGPFRGGDFEGANAQIGDRARLQMDRAGDSTGGGSGGGMLEGRME